MRLIKTELLELKIHPVKRKVLSLLMYFGYNNNISSFLRKQKYAPNTLPEALFDGQKRGNEDTIWSNLFQETRVQIKAPNFEKGLGFSFEQSPDYLLRQNNNTLPFGCHAWWKYNMDFWQPYIEQYGFKIPQKNK